MTIFFGCGIVGKKLAILYKEQGKQLDFFVDNDQKLVGTRLYGIPVKAPEVLRDLQEPYEIILTCAKKNIEPISMQLKEMGIHNFKVYNSKELSQSIRSKPRLVSYCQSSDLEDIILYHIFENVHDIFYIDVGSNDPCIYSVTKLLYDMNRAHGINIDPQRHLIDITNKERPLDINLCVGISDREGTMSLYDSGGIGARSTLESSEKLSTSWETVIPVTTLASICDRYVGNQEISFLKIDVEGHEKHVLLGADFKHYRPQLIIMESTLPGTMVPSYDDWEDILLRQGYIFSYMHGVNRYYVRNDRLDLDVRFRMIDDFDCIYNMYEVYQSEFKHM